MGYEQNKEGHPVSNGAARMQGPAAPVSQRMPAKLPDERRADRRYQIAADVYYWTSNDRAWLTTGQGRTIDISCSSVFFSTGEPVPVGTPIELSIQWPARLHGTVALNLLVTGTTVHVRMGYVAVRIARYEFRTRSSRPNVRPFSGDEKVVERDAIAKAVRSWEERNRNELSTLKLEDDIR